MIARKNSDEVIPLTTLQIFSSAMIFGVIVISIILMVIKLFNSGDYPDAVSRYSSLNISPMFSIAAVIGCVVMAHVVPQFLLQSAKRTFRAPRNREDLPFIFTPTIFLRYILLMIVTMIGFLATLTDERMYTFLPFVLLSVGLMLYYFPTQKRMKHWMSNVTAEPKSF